MNDLRQELESALDDGLSEEMIKKAVSRLKDAMDHLESDFEQGLKDRLAYNLAYWVENMANNSIQAILKGNEEELRSYLSCLEGCYTGRDRDHPVIHGRLFETGAIELRKQIVEAHAELLKNERILDLEDQVKRLVKRVNKAEAEKESMWQRVRQYE